jgi:hypothetical protein
MLAAKPETWTLLNHLGSTYYPYDGTQEERTKVKNEEEPRYSQLAA